MKTNRQLKQDHITNLLAQFPSEPKPEWLGATPDGHEATDLAALKQEMLDYVSDASPMSSPLDTYFFGEWPTLDGLVRTRLANCRRERRETAARALAQAEKDALAKCHMLQTWKGKKWGAPEYITPDQIAEWGTIQWEKPGHVMIERAPEIEVPEDRGHEEMSMMGQYRVRTLAIGTELHQGTVKAKRMMTTPDGRRTCQYQVKLRAPKAQKQYDAAKRIAELEFGMRSEMASSEDLARMRDELDALKKIVAQ